MKVCIKCKIEKELTEFDKRGKGLAGHCKTCRKEYVNSHYQRNKEYYKKKAKVSQKIACDMYGEYKESLSCTDCGLSFKGQPYLCDFHHINPLDKTYDIAKLRGSNQKLIKELKKCIPLCANCHRTRTHGQVV